MYWVPNKCQTAKIPNLPKLKTISQKKLLNYHHTSSQIDDNLTPFSIRTDTKSTTSWLDNEFHIPSQANTIKLTFCDFMSKTLTSGKAVIICSVSEIFLFFL